MEKHYCACESDAQGFNSLICSQEKMDAGILLSVLLFGMLFGEKLEALSKEEMKEKIERMENMAKIEKTVVDMEGFWKNAKEYQEISKIIEEHRPEKRPMIIAVDFDGCLCSNEYPGIGVPNETLIAVLRSEKEQHPDTDIILWTCRSGELLSEAVEWCGEQGILLSTINKNLLRSLSYFGGDTRKIFADLYIDDKALGLKMKAAEPPLYKVSEYHLDGENYLILVDTKEDKEYIRDNSPIVRDLERFDKHIRIESFFDQPFVNIIKDTAWADQVIRIEKVKKEEKGE